MKSKIITILLFLFVVTIPLETCFAVKINGVDDGIEWAEANDSVLITEKDSNQVDYGLISYVVDKNGFDVYFLIYFSDKSSSPYESAGILLTFGDDVISIDCKGNVINPDPNSYIINSAVNIEENDGLYCELMIGFKTGIGESVSGKICFIDGEGTHSYHYPFTVINRYEATSSFAVPTSSIRNERTTNEKTTNERTTVLKTTKARSTKYETSAADAKTHKTTKRASNDAADNKTVVYFFEKDVVVSEVYIASAGVESAEPVCAVNNENNVQQLNSVDDNSAKYNEGVNIFRVVCVISGILLGAFAVWVGLNKKSDDNSNINSASVKKEQPSEKNNSSVSNNDKTDSEDENE